MVSQKQNSFCGIEISVSCHKIQLGAVIHARTPLHIAVNPKRRNHSADGNTEFLFVRNHVNPFISFGRPFVFATLVLFQGFVLINFLVKHDSIKYWFFLVVLFPAFLAWIWQVNDLTGRFRWMSVVWLFHVGIGLVPFVGTIFVLIKDKLIGGEPCGADSLILILCVSPLLLLIKQPKRGNRLKSLSLVDNQTFLQDDYRFLRWSEHAEHHSTRKRRQSWYSN